MSVKICQMASKAQALTGQMLSQLVSTNFNMAVCQNLVPLVNIKIAGKWMFIPLNMVLIGIDPYPHLESGLWFPFQPLKKTNQ
jgi:hypothetical protein